MQFTQNVSPAKAFDRTRETEISVHLLSIIEHRVFSNSVFKLLVNSKRGLLKRSNPLSRLSCPLALGPLRQRRP